MQEGAGGSVSRDLAETVVLKVPTPTGQEDTEGASGKWDSGILMSEFIADLDV